MPHHQPFNPGFQRPQTIHAKPRRRTPRWQFRWWLLLVPLGVFLVFWLPRQLHGTSLSAPWEQVMDLLQIHDRDRFTELALLGLLAVAFVAIVRTLRGRRRP
jgi:hypothetical protein